MNLSNSAIGLKRVKKPRCYNAYHYFDLFRVKFPGPPYEILDFCIFAVHHIVHEALPDQLPAPVALANTVAAAVKATMMVFGILCCRQEHRNAEAVHYADGVAFPNTVRCQSKQRTPNDLKSIDLEDPRMAAGSTAHSGLSLDDVENGFASKGLSQLLGTNKLPPSGYVDLLFCIYLPSHLSVYEHYCQEDEELTLA
ncbi:hypothetical protein PG995_013900 [Apiospora arundinis]